MAVMLLREFAKGSWMKWKEWVCTSYRQTRCVCTHPKKRLSILHGHVYKRMQHPGITSHCICRQSHRFWRKKLKKACARSASSNICKTSAVKLCKNKITSKPSSCWSYAAALTRTPPSRWSASQIIGQRGTQTPNIPYNRRILSYMIGSDTIFCMF